MEKDHIRHDRGHHLCETLRAEAEAMDRFFSSMLSFGSREDLLSQAEQGLCSGDAPGVSALTWPLHREQKATCVLVSSGKALGAGGLSGPWVAQNVATQKFCI